MKDVYVKISSEPFDGAMMLLHPSKTYFKVHEGQAILVEIEEVYTINIDASDMSGDTLNLTYNKSPEPPARS